jgi:6-pyruvoyltetrahydropterin/6-carboxytetrahydropterin synthase
MSLNPRIRLVRKTTFSASVRYFDTKLDEPENRALYGERALKPGYGHNYELEVSIEGEIDPLTGMILNLSELDQWLHDLRLQLDHRHLNECALFVGAVPTLERIAEVSFEFLVQKAADAAAGGTSQRASVSGVRVREGEDLWSEVCAQASSLA